MQYNRLGNSDINVSEVSLGCWTMGGLNWVDGQPNGWANVNEDEIQSAIKRALDAGVNHFDNADVYGNGRAECMLRRILKKLGVRSESVIIASKMGHHRGTAEHAYEPAHIRHQCEQSLINLGRDYLDIYYFHHGDYGAQGEYLAGAVDTMNALVREGKVRVKGQSAYSAADFERAVPLLQPDVLQSWAHALDPQFIRPESPVGKLLAERNLSFVAFSPLAQGRLLDKFNPAQPPAFELGDHRLSNTAFQSAALAELKPKLEQIKARFGSSTEDLSAVAQRYVLSFPRVACVIPGFRNERQVNCNLAAVGRSFSAEDVRFVEQVLQ